MQDTYSARLCMQVHAGVEEAVVDVTTMDPAVPGGEHAIQVLLDATTAAHHDPHRAVQEHIAVDVEAEYSHGYEQVRYSLNAQ